MNIYRLRSLHALLNGFHELENQEIYFASHEELNDPLEGTINFFWKGDEVVWKGLLRHYLYCLEVGFSLALLDIPWNKYMDAVTGHMSNIYEKGETLAFPEISERFFAYGRVQDLIRYLSTRAEPVKEDELATHLAFIQMIALSCIAAVYQERGCMSNEDLVEYLSGFPTDSFYSILLENESGAETFYPEIFFRVAQREMERSNLRFLLKYVDSNLTQDRLFFLSSDFPKCYVSQVKGLTYRKGIVACFMSSCTDMAVWGHYGDNHKGACLIFRGDANLKLTQVDGTVCYPAFEKVEYSDEQVNIDFFRSLMTLTEATVRNEWYTDIEGNTSECMDIFNDFATVHQKYWANISESQKRKTTYWANENEYRLIINRHWYQLSHTSSSHPSKKMKYDFADLEGIVFGIRTPAAQKIEIIKILLEKCKQNNRSDFKFYQAQFNHEKHEMVFDELKFFRS